MQGFCVWFTGQAASGKTTIAKALGERLEERGLQPVLLDGDEVRTWLTPDLGFSDEDRRENVLRTARVAEAVVRSGGVALVALVSPYQKDRDDALDVIGEGRALFVYTHATESVRTERGRPPWKGSRYEEPLNALILPTTVIPVKKNLEVLMEELESRKFVSPRHANAPSLFPGRWQPLHPGHVELMRKVLDEGKGIIVGIRDTVPDDNNPYTYHQRLHMIADAFKDCSVAVLRNVNENGGWYYDYHSLKLVDNREVKNYQVIVTIMPDFSDVAYGRTPGWGIRQIHLDKKTESISATRVREGGNGIYD